MRVNFCCISFRTLSVALPSSALPDDGKFLRWGDSAGAVPCGRQEAAQADQGNERRPYLFLYASQKNCLQCLQAWLARGKDVNKGTEHFPDWDALAWAEEASMGFDT